MRSERTARVRPRIRTLLMPCLLATFALMTTIDEAGARRGVPPLSRSTSVMPLANVHLVEFDAPDVQVLLEEDAER